MYQILVGWKTYTRYQVNVIMKPTNPPTQGQLNPRKIRVNSGIWATFFPAANIFLMGWNWFYIGNRTTKNSTRPNYPQTPWWSININIIDHGLSEVRFLFLFFAVYHIIRTISIIRVRLENENLKAAAWYRGAYVSRSPWARGPFLIRFHPFSSKLLGFEHLQNGNWSQWLIRLLENGAKYMQSVTYLVPDKYAAVVRWRLANSSRVAY